MKELRGEQVCDTSKEKSCSCSVAKALGARLADLNAILREPGHLGFRKLQDQFGVSKSSIERHKTKCLRLGSFNGDLVTPLPVAPQPRRLLRKEVAPPAAEEPAEPTGTGPGTDAGTPLGHLGTGVLHEARARVRESAKGAQSYEDQVNWIVSQMSLGQWDGARDGWWLRKAWEVDRKTFEAMIGEAERTCRRDRGAVDALRQVAMGRHSATHDRLTLAFEETDSDEAKAKIGAAMTAAAVAWDRAAGVYDDSSKTTINILGDPRFVEAAKRYVEAVQDVLASDSQIAERVRARLGANVELEVITAVLAEADAAIGERMSAASTPQLPGAQR
jgi:hypothetical protein